MADLIDRGALAKSLFPLYDKDAADIYRIVEDAPSVNRWIPCSDRLPEDGLDVLVYTKAWVLFTKCYCCERKRDDCE